MLSLNILSIAQLYCILSIGDLIAIPGVIVIPVDKKLQYNKSGIATRIAINDVIAIPVVTKL